MVQRKSLFLYLVVAAIFISLIPRYISTVSRDFPVNDGGFFNTLAEDIVQSNFRLPVYTSYNNDDIPFTYPPLGFYALAIIHVITALPIVDIQRFLPLLLIIFLTPAFYLFTKTLFPKTIEALVITLYFTANVQTYLWLLMGSGTSRALGFFFSIIALWGLRRLFQTGDFRYRLVTIIASTATFTSHPEWTVFLITSAIFFIFLEKDKLVKFREVFFIITCAGVLVSPWLFTIIRRHGFEPFITASTSGTLSKFVERQIVMLNAWQYNPKSPIVMLGMVGLLLSLLGKKKYIALWFILLNFTNTRTAVAYPTAPFSLAAGLTFIEAWNYAHKHKSEIVLYILAIFILFQSLSNVFSGTLPPSDRDALGWIKQNTPPDSKFLVINTLPQSEWPTDMLREWFPGLTKRSSVTTIQGYEWKPKEFKKRIQLHGSLYTCLEKSILCYEEWSRDNAVFYTHIYLNATDHNTGTQCCTDLIRSLDASSAYEKIYEESNIFMWRLKKISVTSTSERL